jgi:hypothetical protein
MAGSMVFDTHVFVKKLRAVGFTEEQAEVQAETIANLIDSQLATKRDLKELEEHLQNRISEVEYKLTIRLGAMMAVSIALIAAL